MKHAHVLAEQENHRASCHKGGPHVPNLSIIDVDFTTGATLPLPV